MSVETTLPITVIAIPFDSGRRGYRMGAGPFALLESGIVDDLDVEVYIVDGFEGDPATSAFDLAATTAGFMRAAAEEARLPVLLAGNCINTLAAAAFFGDHTGVVWFDAHGDMNTPATSRSGFLDGMSAATLVGWCHTEGTSGIEGFSALAESRLMLVGTRDLDGDEAAAIERSRVRLVTPAAVSSAQLHDIIDDFAKPLSGIYLHVDLDVLDSDACGEANEFAAPGGLTLAQTVAVIRALAARRTIVGVTISAYDPDFDETGRIADAARAILRAAVTLQESSYAPCEPDDQRSACREESRLPAGDRGVRARGRG